MAATNLSSVITQTVGNSTSGVNLITAPNDSSIFTASTITKSTTTTASELPLYPAVATATKFALSASPGSAYCDFDCPQALLGVKLGLGWFAKASSTMTATITLTLNCYSSTANRTAGTSATAITLQASNPAALATQFYTTFDAHGTNQYYRLTIAFTGQASVFYSIAQFQVGPGILVQGAAVGDWQSYTPTISSSGGGTPARGTCTEKAYWRRVGSVMEIQYTLDQTGVGTAGSAGNYYLSLPAGYNVDTNVISSSNGAQANIVGPAYLYDGTNEYTGNAVLTTSYSPTVNSISIDLFGAINTSAAWSTTRGSLGNATLRLKFQARIPIAEWAGSAINLGQGSQVEYLSSSFSSYSAYRGPDGSVLPTTTPAGTFEEVNAGSSPWQYPQQLTNALRIEMDIGGLGKWTPLNAAGYIEDFRYDGTNYIGLGFYSYSDGTLRIIRGKYRTGVSALWSDLPAGTRYRLIKANPSAPVGFGKSDSTSFGLVAPRKGQYSLTVTSTATGWSTVRAVGVYYQDQDGNHRLKFNVSGTCASAARTIATFTITGVTFKNVTTFYQACQGGTDVNGQSCRAFASPNASTVTLDHASSTTAIYFLSGDCELDSKPTWA